MGQPQPVVRPEPRAGRWTAAAFWRAGLTIAAILATQILVCGFAAVPSALLLSTLTDVSRSPAILAVTFAFAAGPAYLLFALCLMPVSAASTWLTRARTPTDSALPLADVSWPLLRWARYMAAAHVVRVFAGPLFRGTPVWTMYLRWNGARLGRRVYINSLFVSDHNLLDFGDDVVIGAEVHLSGHTVENGLLKTGRVTLGRGVTIGLCSVVDIDVEAGPYAQVGAMSFVPKHARLAPGVVYAGVPVKPLQPHPDALLHDLRAPAQSG